MTVVTMVMTLTVVMVGIGRVPRMVIVVVPYINFDKGQPKEHKIYLMPT